MFSAFPLLTRKKSIQSPPNSPENEVFSSNTSPEDFTTTHPLSNINDFEELFHEIPSYVPHHTVLLTTHEYGATRTPKCDANGQSSYYRSEHDEFRQGYFENVHSYPSVYVNDYSDVFEKEVTTDQTRMKDDLQQESNNLKAPSLKKLILSNEEKSKLLDWSYSNPKQPTTKQDEKLSTQVNHDPQGESENKNKSAFSILSNAIKRSFTRSVSSTSEIPKPVSVQKTKPVSPSSYFDIASPFFRRSRSNTEHSTNGKEMDILPNQTHYLLTHNEFVKNDFNAKEFLPGLSTFQKTNHDSSATNKVEDFMPKMLAKFTIKENQNNSTNHNPPFRSRTNSFFSSLRLKTKASKTDIPNDTWFNSIRRIVNDKDSSEKVLKTSPNIYNPIPVQHQGNSYKAERTAVSDYSSSSDDEFKYRRSASLKSTRASRNQRKLEREAKQKAKQEELKRLHKAQTIQRQLQEVEEKQRALEIQGVKLEKALRGESDSHTQGEAQLLHEWFQLALEKNKLNRYESELLIVAKELDLEDQQGRLEQKLREKMLIDPTLKTQQDIHEEEEMFAEMMKILEKRDQLVTRIEEQRLRHNKEEEKLERMQLPKDCQIKMDVINNRRIV
ncbi:F-actin-monooxygenase MICAL2 [Bombina bombina]|uniref:F-actin-monooxygenase MICAL2 n=1 Tax=Bombina bombina TaxID=8345 RepID=UPI00235AED18|nr:F-actin-monooxygenase MICAL2 [Bombina bombina]